MGSARTVTVCFFKVSPISKQKSMSWESSQTNYITAMHSDALTHLFYMLILLYPASQTIFLGDTLSSHALQSNSGLTVHLSTQSALHSVLHCLYFFVHEPASCRHDLNCLEPLSYGQCDYFFPFSWKGWIVKHSPCSAYIISTRGQHRLRQCTATISGKLHATILLNILMWQEM